VIILTNSKSQQLIVKGNTTKSIVKDDDKMPFTNETLKAAVRDYPRSGQKAF